MKKRISDFKVIELCDILTKRQLSTRTGLWTVSATVCIFLSCHVITSIFICWSSYANSSCQNNHIENSQRYHRLANQCSLYRLYRGSNYPYTDFIISFCCEPWYSFSSNAFLIGLCDISNKSMFLAMFPCISQNSVIERLMFIAIRLIHIEYLLKLYF